VVAREALETSAATLLATIAANAPLTIAAAKRTIAAVDAGLTEAARAEVAALAARCFDSADYKEGRTAFLERRNPVFTGD
jgi:enoyl-CoA hydratase/carnithine racemase